MARTRHREVRVSDDLWRDLGAAAHSVGLDRSKVIRALVATWLGMPGAVVPPRPAARITEVRDEARFVESPAEVLKIEFTINDK